MKLRSLWTALSLAALAFGAIACPAAADNRAIVIGIDQYQQATIPSLGGATNDARSLAKTLEDVAGFAPANVALLVSGSNPEPTAANIQHAILHLMHTAKPGDTVFVLYSGHGIFENGVSYLVPWDADMTSADTLQQTVISSTAIKNQLATIPAQMLLMSFDMCRTDPTKGAGGQNTDNFLGPNQARDLVLVPQKTAAGPAAVVTLFACSAGERSWEWTQKQRGFFSYYLEQGLRSDAADGQGVVHVGGLVSYLEKAVYGAVERQEGESQTPYPVVEPASALNAVVATGVPPGTGEPAVDGGLQTDLQQGFELLQQHNYPAAQAQFQSALSLNSTSAPAADGLGRAYVGENDNNDAVTYFRQAAQSDSTNSHYADDLGNALYAKHDIKGAEQEYRAAMSLDPNNEAPILELAQLLHKDRRDDTDADNLLQQATQTFDKDPNPVDMRGTIRYDAKNYSDAEVYFRKAVSMDLGNGKYLVHLASCLQKEGKLVDAQNALTQAQSLGYSGSDLDKIQQILKGPIIKLPKLPFGL